MYAVFGITMDHCLKVARKKVPTHKQKAKAITEWEWESEVEQYAVKLFEKFSKNHKGIKLSGDLSQPLIAKEFMRLCKKQKAINLAIYQKKPKLNASGGFRNLDETMEWAHNWLLNSYSKLSEKENYQINNKLGKKRLTGEYLIKLPLKNHNSLRLNLY